MGHFRNLRPNLARSSFRGFRAQYEGHFRALRPKFSLARFRALSHTSSPGLRGSPRRRATPRAREACSACRCFQMILWPPPEGRGGVGWRLGYGVALMGVKITARGACKGLVRLHDAHRRGVGDRVAVGSFRGFRAALERGCFRSFRAKSCAKVLSLI